MIKFGTGGFRAIMGEEFTKESVQKIAQAICNVIKKDNLKQKTFIGYDNRFMSENYAEWAAEVFAGNKINVMLMKKASVTPVVNYYAKKHDLDFSIAITASHNPYLYNGVKVFTQNGRDANPKQTKRLEQEIESLTSEDIKILPIKNAVSVSRVKFVDIEDEYLTSLLKLVKIDKTPKIAFDAMFGSSINLLEKLTKKLNIDSTILHNERNAFFAFSMPSPTPSTTTALSDLIKSKQYELGLALDGDGDRLAIIDKSGNYVDNNELMACLYYFFHKYKGLQGDIVKNISSSNLLDALAEKFGQTCHTVNVGFKFVSEKLLQTKALLGGESSGGLAILEHILAKDSMLSILLLLEMLSVMNKTIDEIISEVKTFANFDMIFGEKQFSFESSRKSEILDLLLKQKQLPHNQELIDHVEYQDYIKVFYKDKSWMLVRFSGTEPVLRLYAETKTNQEFEQLMSQWQSFLNL